MAFTTDPEVMKKVKASMARGRVMEFSRMNEPACGRCGAGAMGVAFYEIITGKRVEERR